MRCFHNARKKRAKFGATRERIRQIEAKALRKTSVTSSQNVKLRDYPE